MDDFDGISFSTVPPRPEDPLDVMLRDVLGLVDTDDAPADPIGPESTCDDEAHDGPYCRCN